MQGIFTMRLRKYIDPKELTNSQTEDKVVPNLERAPQYLPDRISLERMSFRYLPC